MLPASQNPAAGEQGRPKWELSDIFRQYGQSYRCTHALPELPNKSPRDLMLQLTGLDLSRCPRCKQGTMVIVAELPKLRPWDSS